MRANRFTIALVALGFFGLDVSAIKLWPSPGAMPTTVPAACRAALTQNITCSANLVTAQIAENGGALAGVAANDYCTDECYNSLKTFQTNVDAKCGSTEYEMYINSTFKQSGAILADGLAWAYNLTCIQDSTGFCLADLYNHTKEACSDCALKYAAVMVSSDFGRVKIKPDAFSSLLSSCSVPASSYPYTYTPIPTATTTGPTTTSDPSATPTCTGTTYTAQTGDTCESISKANSVATDRMIDLNRLDYGCTALTPGTQLCIQDTCSLYTIQPNQTCGDIIKNYTFSLVQLLGWNPTIHSSCDNLDAMAGRSICVSPPGGGSFSLPAGPTTTAAPSLSSSMFTEWTTGLEVTTLTNITTSWYTPVPDPNFTPTPTTVVLNSTLSSLLAERTVYCWINQTDYDNDFDPESLPDGCQSLVDTYCYPDPNAPIPTSPARIPTVCTPDRSDYITTDVPTTTSTPAATPTPTQPGMVSGCTKFHKVVDGDNCSKVASEFSISLDQFMEWNPDVGENCQGLFLDYYVCVGTS